MLQSTFIRLQKKLNFVRINRLPDFAPFENVILGSLSALSLIKEITGYYYPKSVFSKLYSYIGLPIS